MKFDYIIVFGKLFDFNFKEITIGGIQTYIQELATLLKERNKKVAIIQMSNQPESKVINDVTYIGVGKKGKRHFTFKELAYEAIPLLSSNGVIVWGNDQQSCKLKNVTTVAIQHGITFDIEGLESRVKKRLSSTCLNPLYRLTQRINGKRSFENSDYLVCVDYNYLNWYRTYVSSLKENNNIFVIPNFTEIMSRNPCNDKKSNKVSIAFARRFVERRGCLQFTSAIEKILDEKYDIEVFIAGDGPYEVDMRKKLEKYENVFFTKFKAGESLDFHRNKSIAVIPSLGSEGTSLSLLEAMSAGCAVIATNVGGLTNIVIDEYNGIICSPSEQSIYNAILRLIEDCELREKLQSYAYDTVVNGFSIDIWKRKWNDVFDEIEKDQIFR